MPFTEKIDAAKKRKNRPGETEFAQKDVNAQVTLHLLTVSQRLHLLPETPEI